MRFKPIALNIVNMGTGILLQFSLAMKYGKELDKLAQVFKAGAEYELKLVRKKRSLDANAYFWLLADKIAKSINITKEAVYWHIIREVGVFDTVSFPGDDAEKATAAMERFKQNWRQNGLGWLTVTVDKERRIVQAFYGSSRYNTQEMAALIDRTVQIAKEMGIETLTPEELSRMKEDWK